MVVVNLTDINKFNKFYRNLLKRDLNKSKLKNSDVRKEFEKYITKSSL